tara:strand:- start:64 stop:795 length:732 start_codon:yes stop_codon:yes gene_type:complete
MSEYTVFRNVILSDRKQILSKISDDLKKLKSFDEIKKYAGSLETKSNKYLTSTIPSMPDKRRKKDAKFRKISAYLAYCGSYRDSQRDKNGKLVKNVLEVTKEAGSNWKKMDTKARQPWVKKAEELTLLSKKEWDLKQAELKKKLEDAASATTIPSEKEILSMKKKDLLALLKDDSKSEASLKDIRQTAILKFHSSEKVQIPSAEEITKMKKTQLLTMAEKIGIQLKDQKLKGMQDAIINHLHQ